MNYSKEIGTPAMLELCAEECIELAHACLKMSRKLRDENQTPVLTTTVMDHMQEEASDVLICIEELLSDGVLSSKAMDKYRKEKEARWQKRIEEDKERKLKTWLMKE